VLSLKVCWNIWPLSLQRQQGGSWLGDSFEAKKLGSSSPKLPDVWHLKLFL